MRNVVLGALFIAGLWMASVGVAPGRERLSASTTGTQGPGAEGCGQELITLSTPAGDNRQMLTVIDPRTRAVAVYHIDTPSGAITLKGVRNISWDLQMVEYNGVSPLPGELRSMLGQK
jgi:hypothetical protein